MCNAEGQGQHYSIDEAGVWVDCVRERQPVIHNDYARLTHKKGMPEGHAPVIRELVVPVFRDNHIVAILGMGNKKSAYNENDIKKVSTLADMAWDLVVRKQTEEALHESEERYRSISEDMPVLICRFLPNFKITYVNKAYCSYFRKTPEELVGKSFLSMIPEDDREAVVANISLLSMTEPIQSHEHQAIAPDGDVKWQRWTNRALFDSEGQVIAYQSIGEDITERMQYEKERELILAILIRISSSNDKHELIQQLTSLLQHWSGCEAVGVRLREGEDFPYFETRGFPQEFVIAENYLCAKDIKNELQRDSQGNPVLECMCGNVLCGRFDPHLPFFTENGSFWSNNTTELLASTTEADRQARTRNRCHGEGYESVALNPIRQGDQMLG